MSALLDAAVKITVRVGGTVIPVRDATSLNSSDVLDLDVSPDDVVEIWADGELFAVGQLLQGESEWAVRITALCGASSARDPDGEQDSVAQL